PEEKWADRAGDKRYRRALLCFRRGGRVIRANELQGPKQQSDGGGSGEASARALAGTGSGIGERDRQRNPRRGQDPGGLREKCDLDGESLRSGRKAGVRTEPAVVGCRV